jgi:hypothetical protein
MDGNIQFGIQVGNILEFNADVVFFKYAQSFYGADAAAVNAVTSSGLGITGPWPQPGNFKIVNSKGALASPVAVFLGVKPLFALDYNDIRDFGFRSVEWLANHLPSAQHAAMTMHGPGIGLDDVEAAQALLAGCKLGVQNFSPRALERITWVEIDKKRADRFRVLLKSAFQEVHGVLPGSPPWEPEPRSEPQVPTSEILTEAAEVGEASKAPVAKQFGKKPHIFVAMPFSKEFDDTFHFGIQSPVRRVGFLCERIDQETFTGDVLDRIKQKIEAASIIIGELTGNNANVYLEIGYAWGKGRPTILLSKEETTFDTRNQKILRYSSIKELSNKLTKELRNFKQGL